MSTGAWHGLLQSFFCRFKRSRKNRQTLVVAEERHSWHRFFIGCCACLTRSFCTKFHVVLLAKEMGIYRLLSLDD